MTQNWHVYAICCQLEVDDVISSRNIKTIQGYALVNFEGASFSTFQDFPKRSFCHGEVSDSIGSTNTICNRMAVDDDAISGTDVDTFQYYAW